MNLRSTLDWKWRLKLVQEGRKRAGLFEPTFLCGMSAGGAAIDKSSGKDLARISGSDVAAGWHPADPRLADLRFDPKWPPPDEPVLLSLNGVDCATAGNFSVVVAQKKTGKTGFFSGMLAACISDRGDTLGCKARNPDRKAVLFFDCEQSKGDFCEFCRSVLRRANLAALGPFAPYWLKELPISQRWKMVEELICHYAKAGNGIFIVVIDGYADLVQNVNDAGEAAEFVNWIHTLAAKFNCHVSGALHLNPGSKDKGRGHLGSELERKSETNFQIEKNSEVSCVWADHNRGAPIPKEIGSHFRWSSEARMHLSVVIDRQDKSENKTLDVKTAFQQAFKASGKESLPYNMLIKAIISVSGNKSKSTAERIFRSAKTAGHITKNADGEWRIMP